MAENCVLKGVDGKLFTIPIGAATLSAMIKGCLEDVPASPDEEAITVGHERCTAPVLEKVVEWMKRIHELNSCNAPVEDRDAFNKQFFKEVSGGDKPSELLFFILLAANYLDIPELLDLSCKRMADYIRACKTPEEIREKFDVTGDFTPEEEEEVRKKHGWCDKLQDAKSGAAAQ